MANFMSAEVEITVDDSKLDAQLNKAKSAVTKTVDRIEKSWKRMSRTFKGAWDRIVRTAKWGAVAVAGAFALVTRAAMKQEDAINRLNITLKATGAAAGFSAKQIIEQAKALQSVTRFGDETIIAMQTMLLTFKNIKGDEFKRATEAALDMATAEAAVSGRAVDLTAASIRLGKALNDPLLGMTALQRVGVQFDQNQRNLIETLVRTGRVAEAQGIILTELESQFGGMARDVDTASGALKQMWNALGDVAERIGDAFLPGIKDTARAIKEWAEFNEERIGMWAEKAAAHIIFVKDIMWTFVKFIASDWRAGVQTGLQIILEVFKAFGNTLVIVITDVARRAWKAFVKEFGEGITNALETIFPVSKIAQISARMGMSRAGRRFLKGEEGRGFLQRGRVAEAPTGIDVSERLKDVWQQAGLSISEIIPPELKEQLEEPLKKLETNLESIGMSAEEIEEPMKAALVDAPQEAVRVMDEARATMQKWAFDAQNVWGNLSSVAVSALDGLSSSLSDLVIKGKADFNALAESILSDLGRMIMKATMAQALGVLFPGLFAPAGGMGMGAGMGMAGLIPGLQEGGEVTKTGIAKVHKGERFSGVNGETPLQAPSQINLNVNAIDAQGTFQFLNKNKRAIATMIQSSMNMNHSLRRSKTGWK